MTFPFPFIVPRPRPREVTRRVVARIRRVGEPQMLPSGWLRSNRGSATAEYAIATMAAVGFAGLLVVIMRGDEVRGILTDLVHRALTFAG